MSLMLSFDTPNFNSASFSEGREISLAFFKNEFDTRLIQSDFVGEFESLLTPERDVLAMQKCNLFFIDSFFEGLNSEIYPSLNLPNRLILKVKLVNYLPFGGGFLPLQIDFNFCPNLNLRSRRKQKPIIS